MNGMPDYTQYTYEWLLNEALSHVPETVDKRPGSIIYDALAPAMYELALYFMEMQNLVTQTFVDTASGEALDKRAEEQGIKRDEATYAVKRGRFINEQGQPMNINIGSRFSIADNETSLNYTAIEQYRDEIGNVVNGDYLMRSETVGTVGNMYTGRLIPITYIRNLASATLLETVISAKDQETDEQLRDRYFQKVNDRPFGGNIAQYDEMVREISGVGEVQVYPTWAGGGSVKLSVVDSQFDPLDPTFMQSLAEQIDPENNGGKGLGLAPIGHHVTVVTPDEVAINIDATVTLQGGISLSQVTTPVESKIKAYIQELKSQWGVADQLNNYRLGVYIARINAEILSVPGIINVSNVKINGAAKDLVLEQDATTQRLPKMGSVVLSE